MFKYRKFKIYFDKRLDSTDKYILKSIKKDDEIPVHTKQKIRETINNIFLNYE